MFRSTCDETIKEPKSVSKPTYEELEHMLHCSVKDAGKPWLDGHPDIKKFVTEYESRPEYKKARALAKLSPEERMILSLPLE